MSGYSPCPPPSPQVCPQVCPPPPPAPPCRVKPIMRGLHWAQTKKVLVQALLLSCLGGTLVYTCIGLPRRAAYKDFYLYFQNITKKIFPSKKEVKDPEAIKLIRKGEFDDWADEMARKGLFQSVPLSSFVDKTDTKAKK